MANQVQHDAANEKRPNAESSLKRQQILDGAHEIFAEHGYEGASMSHIARHAGVSKGTLYNYFTNKSDLFEAFVEQVACAALPDIFGSLSQDMPIDAVLKHTASRMIRIATRPTSLMLYRIIVAEAGHFPHLAEIFWKNGPLLGIRTFSEWLAERSALGLLNTPDPEFAAEQFYAMCMTRIVIRHRLQISTRNDDAEIDHVAQMAATVFLAHYGPKPDAQR